MTKVRLLAVLFLVLFGQVSARNRGIAIPRPVSGFAGADYDPAISPDGKLLAFTSMAEGNEDIWVVELQNGHRRKVTSNSSSDYSPWFLGNDKIVFISTRDDAGGEIFQSGVGGGEARKIAGGQGYYDSPSVSPDRRSLAYVSVGENGHERIFMMNLKDGTVSPGPEGIDPSFSLSGDYFVFVGTSHDSGARNSICIYDIAAGNVILRTEFEDPVSSPAFLPGDQSIVFSRHFIDSDSDGIITRNDRPELCILPIENPGEIEFLYPGFGLGESAVSSKGDVYGVSRDFDIYALSVEGIAPQLEYAGMQSELCDSLTARSTTASDSLVTAAVCLASYNYYPDSCGRYLLAAADYYSALGMEKLSLAILGIAEGKGDPELSAEAGIGAIRIKFRTDLLSDREKAWEDSKESLRDIMDRPYVSTGVIQECYLTGIELSHEAGLQDESNSLIVEGLLLFTGDEDFQALLEMWRLRNISAAFMGDPSDIAPLFINYLESFSDRPALEDSVVNGLIGLTEDMQPGPALFTLENLRAEYEDKKKVVAASLLEQGNRLEETGRADAAALKYRELLHDCPEQVEERFLAFQTLGDIEIAQNRLASAAAYYDSAKALSGDVKRTESRDIFERRYALLNVARGYDFLDEDPVSAGRFFEEALMTDESDPFAIWGLAKAGASIDHSNIVDSAVGAFTNPGRRAYFNALVYIIEFERDRKIRSLSNARQLLKRAIELDYRYSPPYLSLGYVDCMLEKKSSKKADLYEEAVEMSLAGARFCASYPYLKPAFLLNAADAYFGLGQFKSAYEYYIEATQSDLSLVAGNNAEAYLRSLGESGFQIDSLSAAFFNFERLYLGALSTGDAAQQASWARKLGLIKQLSGDFTEAVEYYEKALPYYLSVRDYFSAMNLLKSEALCYYQYGHYDFAAEAARRAADLMKRSGKRKRLSEDRIKMKINPFGLEIPVKRFKSMKYGGSFYPHGFTAPADNALLSSILSGGERVTEEIGTDRRKIEILSSGREELHAAGLYGNLAMEYYRNAYYDSAASAYSKAYEISMKREEYTVALRYLSRMVQVMATARDKDEISEKWLDFVEKGASDLYHKFLPDDHGSRAEVDNIRAACAFITASYEMDTGALQKNEGFEKWLENLDDAATRIARTLQTSLNGFRDGLAEVAFEEDASLSSTLSLNEALVSHVLGDHDSNRLSTASAAKETRLSQSGMVKARTSACMSLFAEGGSAEDSTKNSIQLLESIPPVRFYSSETALASRLFDRAAELAWQAKDTIGTIEYLERRRDLSLARYLSLVPAESFAGDLGKAYIEQVRRYQDELFDLRAKESYYRNLGITGQVELKKIGEKILAANSRLLELKDKVSEGDNRLIPLLFTERKPLNLLMAKIPREEIVVVLDSTHFGSPIFIIDSTSILAADNVDGIGFELTRALKSAEGKKSISIPAGGLADRIAVELAKEFPSLCVKRYYSLAESCGRKTKAPLRTDGAAVLRFDYSVMSDEDIADLRADLIPGDSLREKIEGLNYGWLILDGRLLFDPANPLLSYWAYGDSSAAGVEKNRIYVYELFELESSSSGIIVTGFPKVEDPAGRWACVRTMLEGGFGSLIALDSESGAAVREQFVRSFFENLLSKDRSAAFSEAKSLVGGEGTESEWVEFYGESGWNPRKRREISEQWYIGLIARGDSLESDGKFADAARAYSGAANLASAAGIPERSARELSRKLVEINMRLGQYDRAMSLQSRLLDEAGGDIHRKVDLWQEYRDMARDSGDRRSSIRAGNEILALAQEMGDSSMIAETLLHLAEDYYVLDDYADAILYSGKAFGRAAAISDSVMIAEALYTRGSAYLQTGDHKRAAVELETALALFRYQESEFRQYETMAALGRSFTAEKKLEEGREALIGSLRYFENRHDREWVDRCLSDLATNYMESLRLKDAGLMAESISDRGNDDPAVLILSSTISRRKGEMDLARAEAMQAIDASNRLRKPSLTARAYENLGDVFYHLGEYDNAAEQYDLAIEYQSRDTLSGSIDMLRYKKASSMIMRGETADSVLAVLMKETGVSYVRDICVYKLAEEHIARGENGEARSLLEDTEDRGTERAFRALDWRRALLMAGIVESGQVDKWLARADSIYKSGPPEPSYVKDEYHLAKSVDEVYSRWAELALERGEMLRAIDLFERGRLAMIAGEHISYGDLDSLEIGFLDKVTANKIAAEDYYSAVTEFFSGRSSYCRLWGVLPGSSEQFRGTLTNRRCAVRFYQLADKLIAFFISSDTVAYNIVDMGSGYTNKTARQISQTLADEARADSVLEEWYGILFGPFEELMTEKDGILIIPDGPLFEIPFTALKQPEADYLGETYYLGFSMFLPVEYGEDVSGRMYPCIEDHGRDARTEMAGRLAEILGGCSEKPARKVRFGRGERDYDFGSKEGILFCNLRPLVEADHNIQLGSLKAARCGFEGVMQTLWAVPDQDFSDFYWAFLRNLSSGAGLEISYRAASSYVFGRNRGAPFYWAFSIPYMLN